MPQWTLLDNLIDAYIVVMIFSEIVYASLYVLATWSQVTGDSTVKPASSFDPVADADKLYAALTTSKTRIKDLVELLTKRSCAQRVEMKNKFEQKHGVSKYTCTITVNFMLVGYSKRVRLTDENMMIFTASFGLKALDKLLTGNVPVENTCRYDLLLPSCFMCNATLNAFHAGKTIVDDSISVVDITDIMVFCSQTRELQDQFAKEFERINGEKLIDWIDEHTDDDFNSVLKEIVTRTRESQPPADPNFIQATAQAIYDEKEDWEDSRKVLDAALWETPLNILTHVLNAFKQKNVQSLCDEMWKFEDDKAYVYQTIHNFVVNVTEFYSQELNRCFGKKDFNGLLLMRIALITSETNLVEIKQAYQEDFNKSIDEELKQNLCFKENEEYRSLMYGYLGISP